MTQDRSNYGVTNPAPAAGLGDVSEAGRRCPPFIDTGTLVSVGIWLVFHADNGGAYLLQNRGGFQPGDCVRVAGRLDTVSAHPYSVDGRIRANTIELASGPIEISGALVAQDGTLLLRCDSGAVYVLDSAADVEPDCRVSISGTLVPLCHTIFHRGDACILVDAIRVCQTD